MRENLTSYKEGLIEGLREAARLADKTELNLIAAAKSINSISIASIGAASAARDIRVRIEELIK